MKSIMATVMVTFFILGGPSLAGELGIELGPPGDLVVQPMEPGSLFVEGWNADMPYVPGATYTGMCYAFPFSPGSTYALSRIEFMAGGVAGPARIFLLSDSGSGISDDEILGQGSFDIVAEVGWQGADLGSPVEVVEGGSYFIVYVTVQDSYASLADPDDAPPGSVLEVVPHYISTNCSDWDGPHPVFFFMARFLKPEIVPTTVVSWGSVKARYR